MTYEKARLMMHYTLFGKGSRLSITTWHSRKSIYTVRVLTLVHRHFERSDR